MGTDAYKVKQAGRPPTQACSAFRQRVKEVRDDTGYGSKKIHVTLSREGFSVSKRQIQKILDELGLTQPCEKRRGQKKYVRYQMSASNVMWHTDWTTFEKKQYCGYLDDRSRKIMSAGVFNNATEQNALFLLHQAILRNRAIPYIVLSDKGTQFYNSTPDQHGKLTPSLFEQGLQQLGIKFWTCRKGHPQTNGKMEKWFDTMKQGLIRRPDIGVFVKWYNEEYIHESLAYRTPEEIYREML